MKAICFIAAALCLCSGTFAAPGNLAESCLSGDAFRKPLFEQETFRQEQYRWAATDATVLIPAPTFTFAGLSLGETLCDVRDGVPVRFRIQLYSRGHHGPLTDEAFLQKLRETRSAISDQLGNPGKENNRKTDPTRNSYNVGGWQWATPQLLVRMEYSVRPVGAKIRPTPEYLRLTLVPAQTAGAASAAQAPSRPPERRVQRQNGYTEIVGIPMVDQGRLGYCAPAAAARILAYYGHEELDQHQIAQWAKSDAEGGTNPEVMFKGIRRVLHDQYKINVRELLEMDVPDLRQLVNRYNTFAARKQKPTVVFPTGGVIYVNDLWKKFDGPTLREARCSNRNQLRQFETQIRASIDKGHPLLWSVFLGLIPENPPLPQSSGGHMRLIIGYGGSASAPEIVYTDTWGAGHERKTMSLADAFTITHGLRSVSPRLN